jgi:plasmid stability protein
MGQILVRNIDDSLKASLRDIAQREGRSLESLARDLLIEGARRKAPPAARQEPLSKQIERIFQGVGFTEEEAANLELRGWRMQIPDFGEG